MIYLFDDYTLNTELYELRHAGTPCPLEPQVLDILLYLIQHRNRLVTRQALLDHVWPERFITETTLDHRLMQARQAIGDSGQTQRRIKTLRGRGYRFVAAVEERLAPACHARHNAVLLQEGVDMVCRRDGRWRTPRTDTTSQALPTTTGQRVPAAVGPPAVLVGRANSRCTASVQSCGWRSLPRRDERPQRWSRPMPGRGPGRSLLPASPGYCPTAARQILGTAGCHEPESAAAAPGQAC